MKPPAERPHDLVGGTLARQSLIKYMQSGQLASLTGHSYLTCVLLAG